jgi:hypothetical protein
MPTFLPKASLAAIGLTCLSLTPGLYAQQPHISSPKELIGFSIGDDYKLASYAQLETMWKKWATESNRMKLVDIGKTAEGRPQYMAIISSPENLKHLDRYREISKKLSMAEGLSEEQAHALAHEGKAVVWIDGGLHAAETEGSQQIIEEVYELISKSDPETMRYLNDDIVLCVLANPDGEDIMANWYLRHEEDAKKTFIGVPTMYHHYVGHDNNRDFIMDSMPESWNMAKQLYHEWFPQILYNHHQMGPLGAVVFVPPFRDPFNYNFDPQMPLAIEQLGTAMNAALVREGKGGSAQRTGSNYSTWWNGGLRTAAYFHNQIGLLTEIIGAPTPIPVDFAPGKQTPTGDWPLPVKPGMWHFKQSIDYDMTLNASVLDYASRNRDALLYGIYSMGHDSIARGSKDSWTITPKSMNRVSEAAKKADPKFHEVSAAESVASDWAASVVPTTLYDSVLHDAKYRDPRGYIITADQPDMPTAVRFVNALIKNGVEVKKATAAFEVAGKSYPAGSYVVMAAQAFRPEVMDMFEPQDYPNDFAYPGGPPKPPYDMTGWTLVMQMGVHYDRELDGFTGPFVKVEGLQSPAAQAMSGVASPVGYLVSHESNNSYILVNRLLKAGLAVYWLAGKHAVEGKDLGTGAMWVPASAGAKEILTKAGTELGLKVYAEAAKPEGEAIQVKPVRIGLVDLYGGLIPSGWTRWMLEQYEFPYTKLYVQEIDGGNLRAKYDTILMPDAVYGEGARWAGTIPIPVVGYGLAGTGIFRTEPAVDDTPAEYKAQLGSISREKSAPMLKQFVEQGGSLVAEGSSTAMGAAIGIPVTDHLVEMGPGAKPRHLPGEKFYIPGSLLRLQIDNTEPLAYGMPKEIALYYDNNPVFNIAPESRQTKAVGWFAGRDLEMSGWAWGKEYLDGGVPFVSAKLGEGKVMLLGTDVTFRAQPASTFKLLFNGVLLGSAEVAKP